MTEQSLSEAIDNLFSLGSFEDDSNHFVFCGKKFLDDLAEKKGWYFVISKIKSKDIGCSLENRRYAYKTLKQINYGKGLENKTNR